MKKDKLEQKDLWKFIFKITIAILPLLAIGIFYTAQLTEVLSDSEAYWSRHLLDDGELRWATQEYFERLLEMQTFGILVYSFFRNIVILTGCANILGSVFWIISAKNQRHEGEGKFDNFKVAIILFSLIFWVSVLYNISNIFTGALSNFIWYNYISWTMLHGLPQLAGILYLIIFYKKYNVSLKKKEVFVLWGWTMLPLFGYLLFFMLLGMILQATDAFPFFGELSGTGHYPYDFIDLFHDKGNYTIALGLNLHIGVQLILILLFFLVMETIYFVSFYFPARSQEIKGKFKKTNENANNHVNI